MLTRRPRAARRTQRARVDGLGRVGALVAQTRRLGDQSGWTRRRRLGMAGACGNVSRCLNRYCQCKIKSTTRHTQHKLLPKPRRGGGVGGGGDGCGGGGGGGGGSGLGGGGGGGDGFGEQGASSAQPSLIHGSHNASAVGPSIIAGWQPKQTGVPVGRNWPTAWKFTARGLGVLMVSRWPCES